MKPKYSIGQMAFVEDGFDGQMKVKISDIRQKNGMFYYGVEGKLRMFAEPMFLTVPQKFSKISI